MNLTAIEKERIDLSMRMLVVKLGKVSKSDRSSLRRKLTDLGRRLRDLEALEKWEKEKDAEPNKPGKSLQASF